MDTRIALGVGISVLFAFLRYQFPVMPHYISNIGMLAGIALIAYATISWLVPTQKLIPVSDEPVYGELRPANDPTPANACDKVPRSIDTVLVLLGNDVIGFSRYGKYQVLQIGDCEAVSLERTASGIFLNAQLQDIDDNKVVTITENKIEALMGINYKTSQSTDRASLTVSNKNGMELFYARFLNPHAIKIRGILGCNPGQKIMLQDGQPIVGVSHVCSINVGVGGVKIEPPKPQAQ